MNLSLTRAVSLTSATVLLLVALTSCSPKKQVVLPTGPQTLTGAVSPVELSLTRRGTHILRQNGKDVYYVESSIVNLRSFEGMDVTLTGTLEKNTDPSYLPVLVTTSATLIQEPSHLWMVPVLHMTFSAPLTWNGDVFDDGMSFSQTGSSITLLKIHHSSLVQLPTGTPLVVGGERAVLVASASGQVIYIQNNAAVLTVELDQSLSSPSGKEPVQSVLQLLKSIVFTNPSSLSSSGSSFSVSGTGSLMGTPCGGPAGILCDAGNYCAITDTTLGIGVCRPFSGQ
jgi:hypothetical protein